jgi:hypothetical protein
MTEYVEDEWEAEYHREGKGRHRHLERNEDKIPPKVDEHNIPSHDETTPNPGKERVLKGATLPVTLAAAHRIQSEVDKHPLHSTAEEDLKRDAMSAAEHARATHAHLH